ncbi:MAG: hypothetical protein IJJ26_13180 [Victivallales bacterium]|nr:hypothetical protein [Victivallales bacterium]
MDELFFDSVKECFDDGWSFTAPGANASQAVTLPHSWNEQGWSYEEPPRDAPAGTGIYRKTLHGIASGDVLKFEGVALFSRVFLDGKEVMTNLGAYRAFEVPLEGVHEGSELKVEVTDKPSTPLLPEGCDEVFPLSPRYSRWPAAMGSTLKVGGIWRHVFLLHRGQVSLEMPAVTAIQNRFEGVLEFHGNPENYKVTLALSDGAETVEKTIDATEGKFAIAPKNPVFSWPLRPHVYTLTTKLFAADGSLVQELRQPLWLMTFETNDSEFRMNGKPYFLRGQNGFAHCNIPYDKEYIHQYVSAYRSLGVEISRFHTEPPPHEWLDECDRQGVMVILEMPLHGSFACYSYGSEQFQKTELTEILSIVKEYRRHPSIQIWSMGNELIVAAERDRGLGKPLFDILERWIAEVRKLSAQPVISNSNGDAANLIHKTIGDIDDIHQYGGWYTETLYDLRHFADTTLKNDMLFQPAISTESIASYTNNKGECYIKGHDIRQMKIVTMRLGKITDLAKQSQEYQAFMLKEYAEVLWRRRRPDSNFSGYLPFGQYTWFFNPFQKGPDGLKPKMIWDTFREVLGPVHIQLECFDRHLYQGGMVRGTLHLFHENVHLPEQCKFELQVKCGNTVLYSTQTTVGYHDSVHLPVEMGPFAAGQFQLELEAFAEGKVVARNHFSLRCYVVPKPAPERSVVVFDPAKRLTALGTVVEDPAQIADFEPTKTTFLVGAHSLGRLTKAAGEVVHAWMERGGRVIVLEQNPGAFASDIFGSGLGFVRACQPQWSRWAMNLVKHTDRADICLPEDPLFQNLTEEDLRWWNGDTFLAHDYLALDTLKEDDQILSRIGNGLNDDELMPVEYEYRDSGYSQIAIRRKIGRGSILCTSFLLGTKYGLEPVAEILLNNLL